MNEFFKRRGSLSVAPRPRDAVGSSLASEGGVASRRRHGFSLGLALAVIVTGTLVWSGVANAAAGTGTGTTGAVGQKTSAAGQYEIEEPVLPSKVKSVSTTKTATSVPAPAPTASSGTLPFTGLSLLGALALGGALVGVGIALRRRDSRE